MFKAWLRIFTFFAALATVSAVAEPVRGVGFGDSLMAGYQLAPDQSFPAMLQAALRERGHDVEIANAGVSGDTTAGGLARLDWSVPEGADFVILELGANDALRGIAPELSRDNLEAIISRLQARGVDVILAGMLAPPNMGEDYAARFNPVFSDLAKTHDLVFYPFFLDGVAAQENLLLGDGMHPNGDGVAEMVRRFLPVMEAYLDDRAS